MQNRRMVKWICASVCAGMLCSVAMADGINLPSELVEIKEGAFMNNSSITQIEFNQSLRSIGGKAFYGCSSLQQLTLPEGLMTIGEEAFADCTKLTSIKIPDSVTNIGDNAFAGCEGVVLDVEMNSYAMDYAQRNAIDYVVAGQIPATPASAFKYGKKGSGIVINKYIGDYSVVVIPESIDGLTVVQVDCNIFKNRRDITKIVFPDTVTDIINTGGLSNCGVTSINIPANLMSFNQGYYGGHSSIQEVNVSPMHQEFTSVAGVVYSKDMKTLSLVPAGYTKSHMTIPDGVEILGRYAFKNCKGIETIRIPSSVKTIMSLAFAGCEDLTFEVYPKSYAAEYAEKNGYSYTLIEE